MEQKDLNSCYKKRINFELSPKVDPLTDLEIPLRMFIYIQGNQPTNDNDSWKK